MSDINPENNNGQPEIQDTNENDNQIEEKNSNNLNEEQPNDENMINEQENQQNFEDEALKKEEEQNQENFNEDNINQKDNYNQEQNQENFNEDNINENDNINPELNINQNENINSELNTNENENINPELNVNQYENMNQELKINQNENINPDQDPNLNPESYNMDNLNPEFQNQENLNIENPEENEIELPKFQERGINTDKLPEEEIQKLVENNREIMNENFLLTIQNEINEEKIDTPESIYELKKDLNEKDKIFDLLVKSNNDLKQKIEVSNQKYKEILTKIEDKKNEDAEIRLTNQIKEMEKEISANNTETERYKKMIDNLKNKIEFQTNLERAFNLQNVLKQETAKNNELKKQYNALLRVNGVQSKYIKNLDKENQITEKINILQSEIKNTKDTIKEYQEKFTKQDRFLRLIHEKILSVEINIKKMKEPKVKELKAFTRDELKDTVELLKTLKEQITENRNQLNLITRTNDEKLNQIFNQNKKIENDYKEAEKEHKRLLFKKNELKRQIKNSNIGYNTNKQVKKKIYLKEKEDNNNNNKNENYDYDNQELDNDKNMEENDNYLEENENNGQKLFSKNPNKVEEDDENNLDQPPDSNSMGDDNIDDMNDSNAQINNDSNEQINQNIQNNDDLL